MKKIYLSKSKAVKKAFNEHQKSIKFALTDCYKNPSSNKFIALAKCHEFMRHYDGFDLRIISFNSFVFTVGFFGYINNELNFFYITSDKIRFTKVENLL